MKNNIKGNIVAVSMIFLSGIFSSCDKNFEEINTSVDFVSKPNLDYELPFVELTMEDKNYYTISRNVAAFVSQVDDNYTFPRLITPDEDYMGEHFKWVYGTPLKTVTDFIKYAEADPSKVNYLSIGRILRVNLFDLLTDAYGDIPYFEASKGYTDQILKPHYDPQQAIYADMFKELTEAVQAFNISKSTPLTSDIVYKGDIAKWKKFANSLMLRLGLRIMDVDPANGKKYIEQAIAGGLVDSNKDNFVVYHDGNSSNTTTANGIMKVFISSCYTSRWRLASAFVDSLVYRNDPRTTVYAMRPTAPFSSFHDGDHTFANQRGFPQFGGISETRNNFSTANYLTFARYDAPTIWLSYAQVQFNLSECAVRGIISGNAQSYYETGVRVAMDELSVFGPDAIVTPAQADAYLLANPYDPAKALTMINTQYWIETFANWYECWANMRRSDIPDTYSKLDQTIDANFGAALPKRLTYPGSEIIANPYVQDAVNDQGPDQATTALWWDVK